MKFNGIELKSDEDIRKAVEKSEQDRVVIKDYFKRLNAIKRRLEAFEKETGYSGKDVMVAIQRGALDESDAEVRWYLVNHDVIVLEKVWQDSQ